MVRNLSFYEQKIVYMYVRWFNHLKPLGPIMRVVLLENYVKTIMTNGWAIIVNLNGMNFQKIRDRHNFNIKGLTVLRTGSCIVFKIVNERNFTLSKIIIRFCFSTQDLCIILLFKFGDKKNTTNCLIFIILKYFDWWKYTPIYSNWYLRPFFWCRILTVNLRSVYNYYRYIWLLRR